MKIIYDNFIKKNYKRFILILNILKFKNDSYNIFFTIVLFFFFSFYYYTYIRKFIMNNIKTNLYLMI